MIFIAATDRRTLKVCRGCGNPLILFRHRLAGSPANHGSSRMTQVRIYRPAKTAMQSGRGNTHQWAIQFAPSDRPTPDPLMGWNGSKDTRAQLRLRFDTEEEAIAFAERQGYTYTVIEDRPAKAPKPKSYADNFRFDRVA
jgi:hypothetical protein